MKLIIDLCENVGFLEAVGINLLPQIRTPFLPLFAGFGSVGRKGSGGRSGKAQFLRRGGERCGDLSCQNMMLRKGVLMNSRWRSERELILDNIRRLVASCNSKSGASCFLKQCRPTSHGTSLNGSYCCPSRWLMCNMWRNE